MLIRSRFRKGLLHLTLAAVCLAAAAPASAQIVTSRDANGNFVLSNRPKAGSAPVAAASAPRSDQTPAPRYVTLQRSRAYDDLILENARLNGVRADLVRAVVQVESAFNPNATSPKGAMGLMQLMPQTAKQYGVKNAYNPSENVRAGVAYLRQLLNRYENNETLALAAYNAGPGAVDKYDESIPPYRETQNYVAKINQMAGSPIQRRGGVIYRTTEVVGGKVLTRYTDQKPASGAYEALGTR